MAEIQQPTAFLQIKPMQVRYGLIKLLLSKW